MPTLTPVDFDPFAEAQTGAPKLVPVEHDPFDPSASSAAGSRAAAEYQGEPQSAMGYAEGLAQSVAQGTTLGFGDEIAAGMGSLFGLGPYIGGKGYREILDEVRGRGEKFATENPKTALAAELAGGVIVPVGGAGAALKAGSTIAKATRTGKVGQLASSGAIIGAPYGAAYELGTAETNDPGELAEAAGRGLGTGAAFGAVLQPAGAALVPLVEKGVQGTAAALRKLTGGSIKGNLAPEAAARDRVARALAEDAEIGKISGNPPLSEADFTAAAQRGQPVAALDMGGATTRGLARATANTSGAAREMLESATDPRFASQGDRMAEYLRKLSKGGDPNTFATREALQAEARQIRTPLYQKAYQDGRVGIDDAALINLEKAPAMKKALDEGRTRLENRHAVEGTGGPVDDRIVGKSGYTLEYYDAAKQALDDKINGLLARGANGEAREHIAVRDKLVGILDEKVPSYADARGTAANYFGASDALTAGERFATNAAKFETNAAKDALAKMSSREQELFREGFVGRLTESATELGDRRNIVNQLANSSASRERINIVLGPQRAAELEAQLHLENIMELGRKAVTGNSTTTRQLVELGLIGGSGTYGAYSGDPYALTLAGLLGARRGAMSIAEKRTAVEVAKLLTSGDPAALRQAASKMAASGQIDWLRSLDKQLAKAGVWQTLAIQQSSPSKDKKDPLADALRRVNQR
jgi:hypothetical protein